MEDYIYHHGIKGQRWGIRRYQNADGTLTAAGKRHKSSLDAAGSTFKSTVINQTSQKVVGKVTGVDKKKESAKDIAKTIAKGAAIAAATTLLARELTLLTDSTIAKGKSTVAKMQKEQWLDMMIAKHYGWY